MQGTKTTAPYPQPARAAQKYEEVTIDTRFLYPFDQLTRGCEVIQRTPILAMGAEDKRIKALRLKLFVFHCTQVLLPYYDTWVKIVTECKSREIMQFKVPHNIRKNIFLVLWGVFPECKSREIILRACVPFKNKKQRCVFGRPINILWNTNTLSQTYNIHSI